MGAEPIVFLKWAGGKQWLVPRISTLIPKRSGRYFEPFLGGASVFFAVRPNRALLSDSNADLINTYLAIKLDPEKVIRYLRAFEFTKRCYTRARKLESGSLYRHAARFIYLNRTCWNGLYRVNRQGVFNVPRGWFEYDPDFRVTERLRHAHRSLQRAQLACSDFEIACDRAERGDTVYLDPPYTVTHGNNGFLRYNEKVFSWADQERLAMVAGRLARRGCRVILSNADHPAVARLYSGFFRAIIRRQSLVAGAAAKRRHVSELLITNFSL